MLNSCIFVRNSFTHCILLRTISQWLQRTGTVSTIRFAFLLLFTEGVFFSFRILAQNKNKTQTGKIKKSLYLYWHKIKVYYGSNKILIPMSNKYLIWFKIFKGIIWNNFIHNPLLLCNLMSLMLLCIDLLLIFILTLSLPCINFNNLKMKNN